MNYLYRLFVVAAVLASLTGCPSGGGGGSSGTTNVYTIGGSVSGLNGTVVLQNNNADNLTVSANGTFTFAASVADSSAYNVTVLTQPANQTCSVSSGAGTISGNNVTNVAVVCAIDTYSVGGTISGLTGSVVLQNNNADNLTVSANGAFSFATQLANGGSYSVTIMTQPDGQECKVSEGSGSATATVTNILVQCKDFKLFSANDVVHGFELWKTDGSSVGTVMVKDINTSSVGASSWSETFTVMNGMYYFRADDGVHGFELWRSDGTEEGTMMVKDINASSVGASSYPNVNNTVVFNDALYFSADDGVNGYELWKTDGTEIGTVMVKDINNSSIFAGYGPTSFVIFDGALYFSATDNVNGYELWKTDGTADGTVLVKDINITAGVGSDMRNPIVLNGELYFTADDGIHGFELWKSDGTASGTVMVKDINATAGSWPLYVTVFNNALYFLANDGVHGNELWKSDGTSGGTVMIKDINTSLPGASSSPQSLIVLNGVLYFVANDGVHGSELWKTDGTLAGTALVTDINAIGIGITGSGVSGNSMTVFNGELYFAATDGINGYELWKSDGTVAGTVMVKDINVSASGASSGPFAFSVLNGKLLFWATDGVHGIELWSSDGTGANTQLLNDICPGSCSPFPS